MLNDLKLALLFMNSPLETRSCWFLLQWKIAERSLHFLLVYETQAIISASGEKSIFLVQW